MKNRITTPGGLRISMEAIGMYQEHNDTDGTFWVNILRLEGGAPIAIKFTFAEERDAFLARLDNYFQEIP